MRESSRCRSRRALNAGTCTGRRPPASDLPCSSGSLALFPGSAETEPWPHLSCSPGSSTRRSYPRHQFLAGVRRRPSASRPTRRRTAPPRARRRTDAPGTLVLFLCCQLTELIPSSPSHVAGGTSSPSMAAAATHLPPPLPGL